MKLYKLTDQVYETNGGNSNTMIWGFNVTNKIAPCENPVLCTKNVIHAYKTPTLALLLNPIHGNYHDPVMWEADGKIVTEDYGKVGVFELTTKKIVQINVNNDTLIKIRILFAVYCAEAVLHIWTAKYPNDDRVKKAINAAKEYLDNPTAAADAADAAARAAYAAARAAYAAYAADAADAAARAAYAAARAACAAARAADAAYAAYAACAADAAAYAADDMDFNALANKAFTEIMEGKS